MKELELFRLFHRNESGYRDYTKSDLNCIYLAKNLRSAGLSVESLIEFVTLAQLRETQNVEKAQKQILQNQLQELNEKLAEMNQVRDLLVYKIETYDEHVAKFKTDEINSENSYGREKVILLLWSKLQSL